jgi:hypothetical protein
MLRIAKRTLQILAAASALAALAAGPAAAAAPGAYTTKGAWSFVSAPNLHPPKLGTDKPVATKQLAPGYLFLANFRNLGDTHPMVGEGGPLILDGNLQPVWSLPIGTSEFANNLRVQSYNGKPALSWWQGIITNTGATQSGALHVVDQHYRPIGKPLTGADKWIITQHEALLVGHNVWVTAVKTEPTDLSAYGGPANGTVLNAAVQEYDLTSGKLLYTWDAAPDGAQPGHVPLSDSYQAAPKTTTPWDAYHINSIQLGANGFITSFRNTWAAYAVDTKHNSSTSWILGGKRSTFTLPASAQFHWQHDVQVHSGSLVSVFDDACCEVVGPFKFGKPNGPSRGLVLKLDMAKHTASLVAQYTRGSKFEVGFQGNMQLQPNGNVLVGWGSAPYFTEYSKAGKVLLDGVLPSPDLSYRAYLSKWIGLPTTPPSGAARNVKNGKATVYASWDGATKVAAWRVLAGANAKSLKTAAGRARTGFETSLTLARRYSVYKVQALDGKGHVLSTSGAFSVPKPGAKQSPPGFY